ncbi:uncharacterized protein METZ01_LOCUS417250, partial [marine metagenome]
LSAEHPVAVSFFVALAVRLVVAIASNLLNDGTLIPDEGQYLLLALMASEGELTPQFWRGYGQSLFSSTSAFMWPLTAMFWLFGPSRFVAQLLVILCGAVTAAGAAALAHRLLRRPYALGAGLMVAIFPSQVLWSSLVLRESFIWAGLAIIALIVGLSKREDSTTSVLLSAVAVALLFLALALLREQTALLALWCAVPALALGSGRRGLRIFCATSVFLVAPLVVGMGPGALRYAEGALHRVGLAHGYMSMTADSSFGSFETHLTVSDSVPVSDS